MEQSIDKDIKSDPNQAFVACDGCDIAIRKVSPDTQAGRNAKVELVLYQQRGDVKYAIAKVRMTLGDVEQMWKHVHDKADNFVHP